MNFKKEIPRPKVSYKRKRNISVVKVKRRLTNERIHLERDKLKKESKEKIMCKMTRVAHLSIFLLSLEKKSLLHSLGMYKDFNKKTEIDDKGILNGLDISLKLNNSFLNDFEKLYNRHHSEYKIEVEAITIDIKLNRSMLDFPSNKNILWIKTKRSQSFMRRIIHVSEDAEIYLSEF